MLKRYLEFIREDIGGFDTIGEYIEYLSKDNEYAQQIISEFTKDVDIDVRIASAINSLDKHTQGVILKMIQDEISGVESENPVEVNSYTSTSFNESQQIGGKNIFKCFFKIISALGQKNCEIDWKSTPTDFICLFITEPINIETLKGVMSRYTYFNEFIKHKIPNNEFVKLYYGITNKLNVEYGVLINNTKYLLGSFLLSQGAYNFIMTLDLKSSTNLKKFLVNLDLSKLNLLSKVKDIMGNYFPGQSESKLEPTIIGDVISYGYQGLGNWDNGQLDLGEIDNLKNNLRGFLIQHKWSDKVQFNIVPSDNWVFINLKIK